MKHLELHYILTDWQHGFRAKRSTEAQLIQTIHDISKSLDKKETIDMAILDFTKAFDKVPHKRLIHKLNYYGISGSIATWIETFLTGRTQQVVVNGASSSSTIVTSGVPQGTVLGPLLFLLYINDLPDNLSTSVQLFADDCILYTPIRTQNDSSLRFPNHTTDINTNAYIAKEQTRISINEQFPAFYSTSYRTEPPIRDSK